MAERNLRTILKKIYPNGDIDNIFFKTRAKDVVVSDSTDQTLADIAEKVNGSATGATKTEASNTNGNIKIDGNEVNVYEHPTSGATAGTYNSVTVDAKGHVTKGTNVTDWTGTVSGNASNATNTFTQATSRANLTSGEKQSTSFGKIMKWFADLGSMAFTSNVGTANLDSTLTTFYNAAITTDNVTESTSITASGWVADARAIKALQDQITTINSNFDNYLPLSGGTMSGHIKMQNLNDYFAFLKGRTITDSHTSYITVGIAANSGALTFEKYHCTSSAFDGTARDIRLEIDSVIGGYKPITLTIKIDGVEYSYPLFGGFNKPSGKYSATGSTTSFDIDTNGIGYAIAIHNTAGMAFVTDAGAICKTYSGTNVYGLPASKCKFSDGIITIACTDTCVNNTGTHYYQVL